MTQQIKCRNALCAPALVEGKVYDIDYQDYVQTGPGLAVRIGGEVYSYERFYDVTKYPIQDEGSHVDRW